MIVVPILLYHSVSAEPPRWIAPYTVTPEAFANHLDLLVQSGRTPMTVSELTDALRGRTALPSRPVVVTFDDGFADFVDAANSMASVGVPSTLYVTTGALRGRGRLDWNDLSELADMNVEIGSHSHTHPQLDTLPTSSADDEVRRSKHLLEDALGHEVRTFAYPQGFHGKRIREIVQAAGYDSACGVMNAFSSEHDHIFALARLTVLAGTTPQRLTAWLSGHDAPIAPFPEKLRTKAWRSYRRIRPRSDVRRQPTH